jgi:hypothetical protein
MRNSFATAVVFLAVTASSGRTALAEPREGSRASHPGADGSATKTHYEFDDDNVEGNLVRPDDSWIESRRAAKHSSLIRMRTSFVPELLKSAEDLP